MPADTSQPGEPAKRAYRLGKRRESIDRTRQNILAAAKELFSGPAPGRISLDDVAAKAGVSRATVYYQFKSRRELLDALVLAAIPIARLAELMAVRELPDARDAAAGYLRGIAGFWEEGGPVIMNTSRLSALDTEARAISEAYDEQRRQALKLLAERLASQGYLRDDIDAPRAAEVMWWISSLSSFDHLRRRSALSVDEVGDTMASMLDALFRAPPAPAR